MIEWFNNFENKEWVSFMVFVIEGFYPSISDNLFIKAIQFAKQMTQITDDDDDDDDDDINLTMQARKHYYSMKAYHE